MHTLKVRNVVEMLFSNSAYDLIFNCLKYHIPVRVYVVVLTDERGNKNIHLNCLYKHINALVSFWYKDITNIDTTSVICDLEVRAIHEHLESLMELHPHHSLIIILIITQTHVIKGTQHPPHTNTTQYENVVILKLIIHTFALWCNQDTGSDKVFLYANVTYMKLYKTQ